MHMNVRSVCICGVVCARAEREREREKERERKRKRERPEAVVPEKGLQGLCGEHVPGPACLIFAKSVFFRVASIGRRLPVQRM